MKTITSGRKLIKIFLITISLIIILSSITSANEFTEDSWFGKYFFSPVRNTEQFFNAFYDIRLNNINKRNASSDFKTLLADYILLNNFTMIKNYNSINEVKNSLENKSKEYLKDNRKKLKSEISLFYKMFLEMQERYFTLKGNLSNNHFYRFHHILVSDFEEMTYPDLNSDIMLKYSEYTELIQIEQFELDGSKKSTREVNNLIPIKASKMKEYKNSPLVTYRESNYSENQKERIKSQNDKVIFKNYEVVKVEERRIYIKDLLDDMHKILSINVSYFKAVFEEYDFEVSNKSIEKLLKENYNGN